MRTLLKLVLITVVAGTLAAVAAGQTTRIKFKKGAVSATVSGKLTGARNMQSWVIRVRDGQTLTTEQVGRRGGPITIFIKTPTGEPYDGDMDASCHSRREVTPTVEGDYRITVRGCTKADRWRGVYSFRVTVRDAQETQNASAPSGDKRKWSRSGDPIDTTRFDMAIMAAEKTLNGSATDSVARQTLASAYLRRADALTEARQYASALGDYRRTLKYDPANTEAKKWKDQIIMIYESINRSYPKEGEEPPPLPLNR